MKSTDNHKINSALILPIWQFVGVAGFEPATSSSQTRRDNRATLHPELVIFVESILADQFQAEFIPHLLRELILNTNIKKFSLFKELNFEY